MKSSRAKQSLFLVVLIALCFPAVSALDSSYESLEEVNDTWSNDTQYYTPIGEIHLEELNETSLSAENYSARGISFDSDAPFDIGKRTYSEGTYLIYVDNLENGTEAGDYTFSYTIKDDNESENGTTSGEFNVTVQERHDWDINITQDVSEINTGETGEFGKIVIDNKGNAPLPTSFISNHSIIKVPEDDTIAFGDEEEYRLSYNVPTDYSQKENEVNISVSSQAGEESESFDFTVNDNIDPSIESISITDAQATLPVNIDVLANDNIGIERVSGYIEKPVSNDTDEVVSRFDFKDDNGVYIHNDFRGEEIGTDYRANVVVEDVNGNSVTDSKSFRFTELDNIISERSQEGTLAKNGETSRGELFELRHNSPTTVTLEDYSYGTENTTYNLDVYLIPPEGGKIKLEKGDSKEVQTNGKYEVRISGQRVGDYTAEFSLDAEDYVKTDDGVETDISISGEFTQIVIPGDKNRDWAGAEYLKCQTENLDTGNLEDARYTCEIPFYLDEIGDFENTVFPLSTQVYDNTIESKEDEIQHWKSEYTTERLKTILLMTVIIIGSGVTAFLLRIYPRMMIMLR